MSENNYYDLNQAATFLETLDPTTDKFCFQFFRKQKGKPDSEKPPILNDLQSLERVIAGNQQTGFNVSVVVSKTSTNSRKLANITGLRAAFIDFDSKLIGKQVSYGEGLVKTVEPLDIQKLKDCKFPPHIIIESSPGNYHAYWMLNDPEVIDDEEKLERKAAMFSELQKRLAFMWGSDPSCTGINWCMCIPGFWRFKEDEDNRPPSMVKIIAKEVESDIRYLPNALLDMVRKETLPSTTKSSKKKDQKLQDYDEDMASESEDTKAATGSASARAAGRKWLLESCDILASMHEGGRDTLLNEICWTAGGYIASGALDEDDAKSNIRKAAHACGLDDSRINDKLTRVINQGKNKPLVIDPRIINLNKPREVAMLFVESFHSWRYENKSLRTLQYWRGEFWSFQDGHYKNIEADMLQSSISYWLAQMKRKVKQDEKWIEVPIHPKVATVTEIYGQLKHLCTMDASIEPNTWIKRTKDEIPTDNIVAFSNGLLDTRNFILRPCDPRFFNTSACSQTFNPNVEEPKRWLQFLRQIFVINGEGEEHGQVDEEQIFLLQEFMGYLLTRSTRRHKMLVMVGPTRGGKGTIESIIRRMLGEDNVGSFDFATLCTDHGTEHMVNKTLSVCSDYRDQGANRGRIVSALLGIIANDPMSVNPKGVKIRSMRLNTRLMICSNDLPTFKDPSGAMFARLLFLETRRSFLGRENFNLVSELSQELQAITMWALKGLIALEDKGDFTVPTTLDHVKKEVRDADSPLFSFVTETMEFSPGYKIGKEEAYSAYKDWCDLNGHVYKWTAQVFHRNLLQLYGAQLSPRVVTPSKDNGFNREPFYVGAALISEKNKTEFPRQVGKNKSSDIPF